MEWAFAFVATVAGGAWFGYLAGVAAEVKLRQEVIEKLDAARTETDQFKTMLEKEQIAHDKTRREFLCLKAELRSFVKEMDAEKPRWLS